ncbi:MAG: hypothetical protein H6706_23210 [Myxococcales bacterium]|nr:hypothetical protein [Myxococcales bacterium]
MDWLTQIGLGVGLGAVLVAVALFRGRGRRDEAPLPLPAPDVARLGYRSLGASTARRVQGDTPIVFDWSGPAPVWRTAADGDPAPHLGDADVAVLLGRLGAAEVRGGGGRLEVVGGDAGDASAHLAAAELLAVLARRVTPRG